MKKELKNHKVLSANIVEKDLELILPEVCMSKHLMAKNMPRLLSKLKMETMKQTRSSQNQIKISLKVSRSRKKIFEPQVLPKNERMNLFFYPDDTEILETWISIESFKYFHVVRIEKQISPFIFGRSYSSTILFRDLLTFSIFNQMSF